MNPCWSLSIRVGSTARPACSNPSGTTADPPAEDSSPAAQRPLDAPVHQAQVETRILWAPRVVPGSDGRRHPAHELRIASARHGDDPIKRVRLAVAPDRATLPGFDVGYGRDVLAVADGVVVDARDSAADGSGSKVLVPKARIGQLLSFAKDGVPAS